MSGLIKNIRIVNVFEIFINAFLRRHRRGANLSMKYSSPIQPEQIDDAPPDHQVSNQVVCKNNILIYNKPRLPLKGKISMTGLSVL